MDQHNIIQKDTFVNLFYFLKLQQFKLQHPTGNKLKHVSTDLLYSVQDTIAEVFYDLFSFSYRKVFFMIRIQMTPTAWLIQIILLLSMLIFYE